jgi:hypothetical protein
MDNLRQRVYELSGQLDGTRNMIEPLNEERKRMIATAAEQGKSVTSWSRIVPIIEALKRVRNLSTGLSAFTLEAAQNMPSKESPLPGVKEYMMQVMEAEAENKEAFEQRFLQDLVKVTTDLKSQFGLTNAVLDDIFSEYPSRERLQAFVDGLNEIDDKLRTMLAEKVAEE